MWLAGDQRAIGGDEMTVVRLGHSDKRAGNRATLRYKRRTHVRSWLATWLNKLSPCGVILLLALLATGVLAQGPPVGSTPSPQALAALSPAGVWSYLKLDGSGNLYTSGSPTMGPSVGATPPAVAMAGFNPTTGRWEYLTLDANGNLNVSSSGGGGSGGAGAPSNPCATAWAL